MNSNNVLLEICMKSGDIPGTILSGIWYFITSSFSKYWYIIIPVIIIWIIWEILSRDNHDYNSKNGFTPMFNSFVGAGVFCLFQYLTYLILVLFWGKGVYCAVPMVSGFHIIPFFLTGIFLNLIGFWKYLKF